jgi:ferredoxin
MAISKVWVEEGCISCNACIDAAPDVFELDDNDLCVVKAGADLSANEDAIKEAAESCPVEAIKYE